MFGRSRRPSIPGRPVGGPCSGLLLGVGLLAAAALSACTRGPQPLLPPPSRLHLVSIETVESARRRLPPLRSRVEGGELLVPNLAPDAVPRDLDAVSVGERKRLFVRMLLPHVLFQNEVIRRERALVRETLKALEAGRVPDGRRRRRLAALFRKYRFRRPDSAADAVRLRRLLRRVDEIPPSLALAQAAIESGWGLSRFAREGNNIFGHWKTRGEGGMVPAERPEGASYSLAVFSHLSEAVEKYFLNLNTHAAYRGFRDLRARMRKRGLALDPILLATALEDYSSRGREYVIDLVEVMRHNRMTDFDRAELVRTTSTRYVSATLRLPEPGEGRGAA